MLNNEKKIPLWAIDHAEKVKQKEELIGELLFFAAFFSYCIKYTLDYSGLIPVRPEILNSLFVGLCLICLIVKISLQRYTTSRFILIATICIAMGYSSLISINYNFLLSFLLIISMQDIELEKIVKVGFFAKITSISVHVIWYIFVYNTNPSAIRFVWRVGGEARHFFFMGHANNFMAFLVWACLDFIYLNYEKLTVLHIVSVWLVNLIFYTFTDSNSGIIVLAIVSILIFLDKMGKAAFDKLLTAFARFSYVFFALFFMFLTVIYTRLDGVLKEMWDSLDSFLTGRIWFGAYSYDVFGFTFIGRAFHSDVPAKIFWDGRWNDYFIPFDNYYLSNLYHYGIINLVFTALAFLIFTGKMENREKIIIIAFSFYSIMEIYGNNIVICSALFIIGKYIYRNKNILEDS